jgi:DNA (cytosine-5)-methyltransferase 1
MERILALNEQGMNWRDLPPDLLPNNIRKIHEKYPKSTMTPRWMRLSQKGFFSTILTRPEPYWGAFIHPTQDRLISVREAARGQTFPDSVKFYGDIKSQYRQVGNAVPPMMAKALGSQIMKHFEQMDQNESENNT